MSDSSFFPIMVIAFGLSSIVAIFSQASVVMQTVPSVYIALIVDGFFGLVFFTMLMACFDSFMNKALLYFCFKQKMNQLRQESAEKLEGFKASLEKIKSFRSTTCIMPLKDLFKPNEEPSTEAQQEAKETEKEPSLCTQPDFASSTSEIAPSPSEEKKACEEGADSLSGASTE